MLHKAGLRERLRPVRAAPGLPFDHGLFEIVVEDFDGNCIGIEQAEEGPFISAHDPSVSVRENVRLLLCAHCDQFVLPNETRCPHCGSDALDTFEERQSRSESLSNTLDLLRSSLRIY